MRRQGVQLKRTEFGVGLEFHTTPAHVDYDLHVHFVLEVSHRLDCASDIFDLVGASGSVLRTHITVPETDVHWENQIRCA